MKMNQINFLSQFKKRFAENGFTFLPRFTRFFAFFFSNYCVVQRNNFMNSFLFFFFCFSRYFFFVGYADRLYLTTEKSALNETIMLGQNVIMSSRFPFNVVRLLFFCVCVCNIRLILNHSQSCWCRIFLILFYKTLSRPLFSVFRF